MFKNKNKNKGFTLVELIVVIAIVLVLVLVAGIGVSNYIKDAKHTKLLNNAKTIQDSISRYYVDNDEGESSWPRLTEEDDYYTYDQLIDFSKKIYDSTGKEVVLNEAENKDSKYYNIDFSKLSPYMSNIKENEQLNYVIQNPVGDVYYLEDLTTSGKERFEASKPTAVISISTAYVGEVPIFDFSNSTDPKGKEIIDVSSNLPSVYTTAGTFTYKFKVKNEMSIWSDEVNVNVTVHNKPTAGINLSIKDETREVFYEGDTLSYEVKNYIDSGSTFKFAEWFIDGESIVGDVVLTSGNHVISLFVTNNDNIKSDIISKTITVNNKPNAEIKLSVKNETRETFYEGDTLVFEVNNYTDDASTLKSTSWKIDGEVLTVDKVLTSGSHIIYLTVTNNDNISTVINKTITVIKKPVAVITITPNTNITTATTLTYSYAYSTDFSGTGISEVLWTNNQTKFTTAGAQTIKLKVKDGNGVWSDEVSVVINITNETRTILNPGSWVSGGITGWESYNGNWVSFIDISQVSGQYTELRARSGYAGGFSEVTVYALPKPLSLTGFTKMRVTYGSCNSYVGSTFLNVGGIKYDLNNVSNKIIDYNISGNINIGIEMAATSAEQRYIRIVKIELLK